MGRRSLIVDVLCSKVMFLMCIVDIADSLDMVHYGQVIATTGQTDASNVVVISTDTDISVTECIESCKLTKACHFVNYHVQLKLCNQVRAASIGQASIVESLGSVYGNKSEWEMGNVEGCNICNGTELCNTTTPVSCEITGCGPPSDVSASTIFGNVYKLHSQLVYTHVFTRERVTYTCAPNGVWVKQNTLSSLTTVSSTTTTPTTTSPAITTPPTTPTTSQTTTPTTTTLTTIPTTTTPATTTTTTLTTSTPTTTSTTPTTPTTTPTPTSTTTATTSGGFQSTGWIPRTSTNSINIVSTPASWSDARDYCDKEGYLVVIYSSGEQTFVSDLVTAQGLTSYWAGATDAVSEATWVWVLSTLAWNYQNWGPTYPGYDSSRDCLLITPGNAPATWSDADCDAKHSFVCERFN